jgi:adenylosuccinate synthase
MKPRNVPTAKPVIVVGLGFGDEGKGATVDWLCAQGGVSAVVRFNGGAQAAHNVVADGIHHTFAQFGSGTLAGVPTYLSDKMLIEPISLAAEADALERIGVGDPFSMLTVHPDALLTTPVHVAANRTREDARGTGRHGSCGRGIGETAFYETVNPAAPRVRDCLDPVVLRNKLDAMAYFYEPLIGSGGHSHPAVDAMCDLYTEFAGAVRIAGNGYLTDRATTGRLVLEGAQGVLLDEWRGFHPHTTWSTTTPANARTLLRSIGQPAGFVLGVLRTYQTRHGAGPLPSEDCTLHRLLPEPHNGTGVYQGDWRVGHLDPVVLRYAVQACGGLDGLALTHLDRIGAGGAVREYRYRDHLVRKLPLGPAKDLDHQSDLTRLLASSSTILDPLPNTGPEFSASIEQLLGAPVVLRSDGPDRKNRY